MPVFIFQQGTLDLMAQVDVREHLPLHKYPEHCEVCGCKVSAGRCIGCGFNHKAIGSESPEECAYKTRMARDGFKHDQLMPMHTDEYSFIGALRKVAKSALVPYEDRSWEPTDHCFTIYGVGGWHRWMVTYDGEIRFSAHHSNPERVAVAEKLGFRKW